MNNDRQVPSLVQVEQAIGGTFHDRRMLEQAFVHRSFLNENPSFALPSNERLEFLGDAVIGFLAADWLYRSQGTLSEGELTRLRAAVVRTETLARVARMLDLGKYLYLGRGEEASGGRKRQTLLAATFEALVGAAFLDLGLDTTRDFVYRVLEPELKSAATEQTSKDYKSRLQELTQAKTQVTPLYRTVAAEGPDHEKVFTIEVLLGEQVLGSGKGHSKQEAEQDAARAALEGWDGR